MQTNALQQGRLSYLRRLMVNPNDHMQAITAPYGEVGGQASLDLDGHLTSWPCIGAYESKGSEFPVSSGSEARPGGTSARRRTNAIIPGRVFV